MNHLIFGTWRRVMRQSGPLMITGIALLLGSIAIFALLPTLFQQTEELEKSIVLKSASKPPTQPTVTLSRVPVGQQIGDFVSAFPPLAQNSADLNEVFLSANRHNVQLPRGEYQFKQDASAPLVVFSATFPISADYAAIKDFTSDVLRASPNVSMDELRMTRSSAGSNVLESIVRFSFVYRKV